MLWTKDEDEENGEDYDDSNDATWWQDNELDDDEDYKDKGPGRTRVENRDGITVCRKLKYFKNFYHVINIFLG